MSNSTARNKADSYRTFIALDIGQAIRERLGTLQLAFADLPFKVRWVKPANIHLTLVFLGDVAGEQMPRIQQLLDDLARRHLPFELVAEGVGYFGSISQPRVIWTGIKATSELLELQADLTNALLEAGFRPDSKAYKPHLTLGRINPGARLSPGWIKKLEPFQGESWGQIEVSSVDLMLSELSPKGVQYCCLKRVSLIKARSV